LDLELEGRAIFLAGSSRGIGAAIARAFVREGARVVITGRSPERLEATRAELAREAGSPGRVLAIAADLRVAPEVAAAVERAVRELGALDAAVANVGSGTARAGWDLGPEDWRAVLDENLLASALLASAAIPHLVASRGSLTFVSSIAGREALDGAPLTYGAAKAALESAMKSLARQLGPSGVRVNAVAQQQLLA
jgi:NAD(P)-dependent dehydrogenase (short-subunit alcohol dehydrogenase family)